MAGIWGDSVPDCRGCRSQTCHEPAEDPVWHSLCTEHQGPDCPHCGGESRVPHYRCPGKEIAAESTHTAAHITRAMSAYSQYHGRHVLPASGGWCDQSTGWAEFVQAVDGERAFWEDQRQRRESEREKRAQSAQLQAAMYPGGKRG